jgi:limonene-1,2-epoxide hydrolase
MTPEQTVVAFLHALEAQHHPLIASLLAPDLRYTNVSLPTLKGGQRVAGLFEKVLRRGTGFGVRIHGIAASGNIVMTERTDIIKVGPLYIRFWVCGTFEVRDGRITVWRDYFDWWNIAKGTLRGVAGIAVPPLRPNARITTSTPPPLPLQTPASLPPAPAGPPTAASPVTACRRRPNPAAPAPASRPGRR